VPAHLNLEKADHFWLQQSLIIRYVETNYAPAYQSFPEASLQRAWMRLLHDEDKVGPSDQFSSE